MTDLINGFDRAIEAAARSRNAPYGIVDAAVCVHELVLIAWESAKVIFEGDASPNLALQIFDRMDAKQRELAAAAGGHLSDSPPIP